MGFWSNILGFFGYKSKEEKEREIQKEKTLRTIKEQTEEKAKTYKSNKESLKSITGETSKELKEIEKIEAEQRQNQLRGTLGEQKELTKEQKWQKRIEELKANRPLISKTLTKETLENINPNNLIIETGLINSEQELKEQEYNIYRNLILKNIQNEEVVQRIFQSHILDDRIVGKIRLQGFVSDYDGRNKTRYDKTFEIKGLTPIRTEEKGLFKLINGAQSKDGSMDSYQLHDILFKMGANEQNNIEYNSQERYYEIANVSVSYNFS